MNWPTPVTSAIVPKTTIQPDHFPLAPSSAWRGLNCPGSWRARDDRTNPKADAGTIAHAFIPVWASGGYDSLSLEAAVRGATAPLVGEPIASEIGAATATYFEYVSRLDGERHFEQKIQHPTIPDLGGTIDCLIVRNIELEIWDFKSGVWPAHLEQLACYSLLANRLHGRNFVHTTIVQPRANNGATIQKRTWDKKELTTFEKRVRAAAKSDELKAGEWCRFCPRRPTCEVAERAGAPGR